jgi:methylmalonyl-CoA/ethylmalonyl-CoA epimerase
VIGAGGGRPLDHIGIAVPDLRVALAAWARIGFASDHMERVDSDGIEVAFLPWGDGQLEIMAPTRPDGAVARFLDRRGPGVHHLAFRVDRLAEELDRLAAAGVRLVDRTPRPGSRGTLVAFLHPSALGGVLTELVEVPHGGR